MKKYLRIAVVLISVATMISGFVQMIFPDFILGIIGGETIESNSHSFSIVGMFMLIFGSLLLHNTYSIKESPVTIFWCAIQKLGAAVAVSVGIYKGLFIMLAGAVAGFDLFSGILFLIYLKQVKKNA